MQLIEFLIGQEQFPIYRTLGESEVQVLEELLGSGFRFVLEEGDPLDELLFGVLSEIAAGEDFYFHPPEEASVVGTFEVRDGVVPTPEVRLLPGRRVRKRAVTH